MDIGRGTAIVTTGLAVILWLSQGAPVAAAFQALVGGCLFILDEELE